MAGEISIRGFEEGLAGRGWRQTKGIVQSKNSGVSNRPLTPILLKSIAIHLPFLSRYFCKVCPIYTTDLYHDTPPICTAMLLQKYWGQGSLEHS